MNLKEFEVTYDVKTVKKVMAIDVVEAEAMAKRAIHGKSQSIRLHSILPTEPETEKAA